MVLLVDIYFLSSYYMARVNKRCSLMELGL
ncbi:Unannotated [Lentimonas sp. CC19]|nr:Unannotated [Lentimonas sp. CC10]CAA6695688.1 Unannotated [Lentimonas sp. CC19]CAA7069983.1 Unannotated [Lentimonas sp. CC11]